MRPEVARLVRLGPFPAEHNERPFEEAQSLIEEYEQHLARLESPATDEEALALLEVFNPNTDDSCFGLAWTLTHFIETAPSWPGQPATTPIGCAIEARLSESDEPWPRILWQRITNWRTRHTGNANEFAPRED